MALAQALCPTVIGREPQLSSLEDALLAAIRGDGGVVLLGAEAGMGKSRLATVLTDRARQLGCTVLFGACSEAELALPYLPFLEAIGNHLSSVDLGRLRDQLGAAADELAQLFPQLGRSEARSDDPMQSKLRLFEAIVVLLRETARERGLLLVLEDLHWADPATRELLDYMTRRLRSTKVLLLATYRSDELHRKHALLPTIQGWRRSGQVELVELLPLSPQGVAQMVAAIFDEPTRDDTRDFLHARCEGNPFVLEELLKVALMRGDIYQTDEGWERKQLSEIRLPETVRDTILLRLERLGQETAEVLAAASVIGPAFDLETLAALTGKEAAVLLDALQTSMLHQLLEEEDRATGTYRFRHALTREAVYEDMVIPRRQQLHSRVADLVAARPDRAAVDLAGHLVLAGRFDEAVPLCLAAAEEAMRARAFSDAAALYERAIPYVKDSREHARLLCLAGEAYWSNSESGKARRLLEQGVGELDEAGLIEQAASQRLLLGRCLWELNLTKMAKAEFERAREVLEGLGPSESLAIAYVRLSGLASFDGQPEEGLALASSAAEIAQRAGAGLALAWSKNFMAIAEVSVGRYEEGFAHLEESYRLARDGNYYFQAGNATYNGSWLALHVGRGRLARAWLDRHTRDQPTDRFRTWFPYLDGLVTLSEGSVDEALPMLRDAVEANARDGHEKMLWRSRVGLAHALAEADRGDEASGLLPPESSRVEDQDAVYDGAARVMTALARRDLDGALAAARSLPARIFDVASPLDAAAEGGHSDPAWLRGLIEGAPIQGETRQSPRLAAARGWLALGEGHGLEALEHLRDAEAAYRSENLVLEAWHCGRALAEAEARAGQPASAVQLLQELVVEASAHGAALAARLARETAESLGLEIAPAAASTSAARVQGEEPELEVGERLVTILFADVRGYTALTGSSPPAAIADQVATLQRWAAQEVARHRGMVDKFAGDALMATFNVAGRSVDHTLQALQAAIAIRDKAALLGLPVGIGIAVGPAIVGRLAQDANVSVLGETTNLASRLQTHSGPGEITLSGEAHRRVRDWLAAREIEGQPVQLELKGFEGAVAAHRLPSPAPDGERG